jgi:hypothetical protein
VSQANSARNEKQQTKMLFDKLTAAIAEIAKERGIDFVIADQPPFAVDRMSPAELQQALHGFRDGGVRIGPINSRTATVPFSTAAARL